MRSMASTERAITVSSLCAGTSTLTKGQVRPCGPGSGSGGVAFSQRRRKISAVSIHMMLVMMG
jgi:hypothetical protein